MTTMSKMTMTTEMTMEMAMAMRWRCRKQKKKVSSLKILMTFSLFAQGNESQQHNYVYAPLLHTFLVHFLFIWFEMQMHNNSYDFYAKLFSTYRKIMNSHWKRITF